MRRRVASFCAALLFITCSIICGPTYASGIWTVDGNVDPWSDLEDLERAGEGSTPHVVVQEAEESAASEQSPPMSEQVGGESVFDGLSADEFFGFTAVTSDGEVLEDGAVEGMAAYDENTNFTGRFLGDDVWFSGSYVTSSTISAGGSHVKPSSFSAFGSNIPWKLQIVSGFTQNINETKYWSPWASSSQVHLFVGFDSMANSELDTVTLHGSFTARLRGIFSSLSTSFNQYSAGSVQLVAFLEGQSNPVILQSFTVSSGVVNFQDTVVEVKRAVSEIGLRVMFSNLPTGWGRSNVWSTSSLSIPANGWELYLAPGSGFGVNFEGTKTEGEITNGLLSGLIEIVTGIYNAVVSLPSRIQSIITSITELPGKLWTLISEGLQSLFIPTEEQLQDISDKYDGLFESKLGFVYQLFSFVVDTFGKIKDALAAADDYSFHFPGVSFPMNGDMVEVIAEQDVSLDNAVMDVLRPVLGTIVTIVCVLAVVSLGFEMVIAILSGKSYSQFIGETREELDI